MQGQLQPDRKGQCAEGARCVRHSLKQVYAPALLIRTCNGVPLSRNLLEKSLIELQHTVLVNSWESIHVDEGISARFRSDQEHMQLTIPEGR